MVYLMEGILDSGDGCQGQSMGTESDVVCVYRIEYI